MAACFTEHETAFHPDFPDRFGGQHCLACLRLMLLSCVMAAAWMSPARAGPADTPAGERDEETQLPDPEAVELSTSDGVALNATFYGCGEDVRTPATVILVHDLEGSSRKVEPLALSLQRAGYSVISPDLRGHGRSTTQALPGREPRTLEPRLLRRPDLQAIAVTSGGRVREQASLRGDLEAVYGWICRQADRDSRLSADRICVAGVGLGGTLAALWTAADALWPPLASGPQGGQVRALALVSPVYATKGVTIGPALQSPAIRGGIPILIAGGKDDRDADRIFTQLKRFRPREWYEVRPGVDPAAAKEVREARDASLFFFQYGSTLSGEKLLAEPSTSPAAVIAGFFSQAVSR